MKKILNWLLEAFMWVYEIFLYSLLLPLIFGVILIFVVPVANWFINLGFIQWFVYIAVGICLKFLRDKYLKDKRK